MKKRAMNTVQPPQANAEEPQELQSQTISPIKSEHLLFDSARQLDKYPTNPKSNYPKYQFPSNRRNLEVRNTGSIFHE